MNDYPHHYMPPYETADEIKEYHEGWNTRFYKDNWGGGLRERQTT